MNDDDTHSFRLVDAPAYVGAWCVGGAQGLRFCVSKRPGWLARLMCRWLLEWEWIDANHN